MERVTTCALPIPDHLLSLFREKIHPFYPLPQRICPPAILHVHRLIVRVLTMSGPAHILVSVFVNLPRHVDQMHEWFLVHGHL